MHFLKMSPAAIKEKWKILFYFYTHKRLLFLNNFEKCFGWKLEPKIGIYNLLCIMSFDSWRCFKPVATIKHIKILPNPKKGSNLWWALNCHHLIILFLKQKQSDNSNDYLVKVNRIPLLYFFLCHSGPHKITI